MSDYFTSLLHTLWAVAIVVGGLYVASYVIELGDRVTAIEQRLDNRLLIPNITIGDNSQ